MTITSINTVEQMRFLGDEFGGNLEKAVSDIGSKEVTLRIEADFPLHNDLTVPGNIALEWIYPYKVTIDSGKTLTITRMANNPIHQIFAGAGSGVILQGASELVNVSQWSSLNTAISDIGSNKVTLNIDRDVSLTAPLTVPSNVTLYRTNQGIITLVAHNLTINGPMVASIKQFFDNGGAGGVSFGAGATQEIHMKWWGATGDGSTDDTTSIQTCLDALADGQTLIWDRGIYRTIDEVTVSGRNGVNIIGVGSDGDGTWIKWDSGAAAAGKGTLKWKHNSRSTLKNIIMSPAVTAESSEFGLYITSDGAGGSNNTSHNLFEYVVAQSYTGSAIQLGHHTTNSDVNLDHNIFHKCEGLSCTVAGIKIHQTNTNNTVILGGNYSNNATGIQVGGVGSPRDIEINNVGLAGNSTQQILVKDTFAASLSISNLQLELKSTSPLLLNTDSATSGWNPIISFTNIKASYNDSGYDIIVNNAGGVMSLRDCQFAGSGTVNGTDARIRYQPLSHADVEGRLITENVILTTGAEWDITTSGNQRVRWLRLGDSYSANVNGDVLTIQPIIFEHLDIENSYTSLDQPSLTGVTVNSEGLIKRKTIKVTINKEAWTAAATSETIDFITIPPKTRVVSVIADTTEAYAGLAGTIQLTLGFTSAGADELIAQHDVKITTVTKGLADADMGTGMTRAAAIQGGAFQSWGTSNQGIRATLNSGSGNIGTGSATNLSAGITIIYLTVETLG